MRNNKDDDKMYPVGLIPGELPEVNLPPPLTFSGDTKIIRVINTALEQLRPAVENAVSMYGHEKIGVCAGSCDIGSEAAFLAQLKKNEIHDEPDFNFQSASFCAEYITRKFGIKGPAFTVATACASGANAIVRGSELIQAGICDAVIAGGADVVTDTIFAGFRSLEALSENISNPFSRNRNGINLGEGAAFFLLESKQNSGVELLGAGESADAYHITAPGKGAANAIKAALIDAQLSGGQIDYVNLHGTGTVLNDEAESNAMNVIFGKRYPPASSTKPVTGHTLGASGALETAICWMVLNEQRGTPLHCWDGACDDKLSFTPYSSKKKVSFCMNNNFGFGGCNVSLILGRC